MKKDDDKDKEKETNQPPPTTPDEKDKTNSPPENPDRFAPDNLRLSQKFHSNAGVKKVYTTIPVRKPNSQEFIRVRPGEDWYLETAILELKDERESYLVAVDLWPEMQGEIVPKALYTTINRQGVLTLWPIRLPGEDGRLDTWNRSAHQAAGLAKTRWIKVVSNMSLRGYDVSEATGNLPDPEWPDLSFEEMLTIAFKDRYIDSLEHPVIRRLRGEM
jgi:hypothetical protein